MDDSSGGKLPPLPPSDADSLNRNYYDAYYQRSARSFWKDAHIESIEPPPMQKCNHFFEPFNRTYKCKLCHFGLEGTENLTLSNGKLFFRNEPLPF